MKKVKLKPEHLVGFYSYVEDCLCVKWQVDSQTLTDYLYIHLNELKKKIVTLGLKVTQNRSTSCRMSLSKADIVTLRYVFNHVKIPPFLASLEYAVTSAI